MKKKEEKLRETKISFKRAYFSHQVIITRSSLFGKIQKVIKRFSEEKRNPEDIEKYRLCLKSKALVPSQRPLVHFFFRPRISAARKTPPFPNFLAARNFLHLL